MKKRIFAMLTALSLVCALCVTHVCAYQSDIVSSREEDGVRASAALLIDAESGLILFEQDAYETINPASVTKTMTALLVIEAIENGTLALDQIVTAGDTAWNGLGSDSSNQNIQVGEEMTVEDLLYCLLVVSANEAANILAAELGGSISGFADMMNQRAQELGCTGTHFVNPHGLTDEEHYTTAYDLYLIFSQALQYSLFRTIIGTATYTVQATNMTASTRELTNTNALILSDGDYYYVNCIGGKTGTTTAAGRCLISAAEIEGRTLICVMMGCEHIWYEDGSVLKRQFSQSKALYEWAEENFAVQSIWSAGDMVTMLSVSQGAEETTVEITVADTLELLLPTDVDVQSVTWEISVPETLQAPVEAGEVVGTISAVLDGVSYGTANLVTTQAVEVAEEAMEEIASDASEPEVVEEATDTQRFPVVPVVIASVVVAAILILIVGLRLSRAKNSYRGRRVNR